MSKTVTLGELVAFVLENRKGNAFKGYEERVIASGIKLASEEGTLLYATDSDNRIVGIIVCKADNKKKEMHVHDFLSTQSWVITKFLVNFRHNWPDYELVAKRKNKFVKYNTTKLYNKIVKGAV